jgi:hypothetical protein
MAGLYGSIPLGISIGLIAECLTVNRSGERIWLRIGACVGGHHGSWYSEAMFRGRPRCLLPSGQIKVPTLQVVALGEAGIA